MSNRFGPVHPHYSSICCALYRPDKPFEVRDSFVARRADARSDETSVPLSGQDDDSYFFPDRPAAPTQDAVFDDSAEQRLEASIAAGHIAPAEIAAGAVKLPPPGPGDWVEMPRWFKVCINAFQAAGWIMLVAMAIAILGSTAGCNYKGGESADERLGYWAPAPGQLWIARNIGDQTVEIAEASPHCR